MYEFKLEDAKRFALEQGIKTFVKGDQLHFMQCPYCRNMTDKKNKFAISIRTGQFNCLRASCGAKGNMLTLAKDFGFSLGREVNEYYGIGRQRHYRVFKKKLNIEVKDAAIEFMQKRMISAEVTKKYQISTDKNGMIIFPFLDESGTLQFVKYRNPDPKEKESKEWAEKDCKPILFGMHQCNLDNDTLILTEGQIDSLSVTEAGFENAVSVPTGAKGFTWVPHCWNWMQNFKKIIVFGDHENGIITLYNEMVDRFKFKVWHVRPEDYKDCKDANDILRKYGKEQIRICIENAVQLPIPRAMDLSKVENVDPNDIEKLPTGLNCIDDLLFGGLPFGQLILLTGKAGDGKSTLASQLMLSALQYGYKCFAYSGELPNYLFKSWIDFQAAGASNTYEIWSKWTHERPRAVKTKALEKITKWYSGKFWLYDNSASFLDEEDGLISLMQQLIIQYGVRVFLVDNLMTALDLEKDLIAEKYEKQSLMIKKLARIALQYGVLIILIAHKRKDNGYAEVNESISGSLDIVNLASIVLSYERPSNRRLEIDDTVTEDDRILKVTKNRLFGKIDNWGFVMKYDPNSKRIYTNPFELDRKYAWEEVPPKPKIEPAPF